MHFYADQHGGRLPPAALCDQQGRPLLSWRVLILPYLEQEELYKQFRRDEPWDSAHNLTLLSRMPRAYALPPGLSAEVRTEPSSTFYQVFTGRGTAFEGTRGLHLHEDFPDGISNTILVIEAGEAVPWTKPADLAYEADRPLPPLGGIFTGQGRFSLFGPSRTRGFSVAVGDSSIHFLTPAVSEATLRDAITRDDGRSLGDDW